MHFSDKAAQLKIGTLGKTRPDLPHCNFPFKVVDTVVERSDLNTVDDLADYRVTAVRKFRGFKDKR